MYPILPVSLDCPFCLPLRYSLTFICRSLSVRVPYVASFSGLSIVLPLRYSLMFICRSLIVRVPYFASFSELSIFDVPFGILWRLFVDHCLFCCPVFLWPLYCLSFLYWWASDCRIWKNVGKLYDSSNHECFDGALHMSSTYRTFSHCWCTVRATNKMAAW